VICVRERFLGAFPPGTFLVRDIVRRGGDSLASDNSLEESSTRSIWSSKAVIVDSKEAGAAFTGELLKSVTVVPV